MIDKLGGRKFVAYLILLGMGFIFVLLNLQSVEQFMTFATAGLAIYTTGNVVSDFSYKH